MILGPREASSAVEDYSKIIPIYKKGPRDSTDNYRPISLLPAVAKILEAIINRQLYEHLVCNDLLSEFQSGFRRGDSTSLQLFRVVHQLMSAVDLGKATAMVFYDFRKAFDTVWHAGLLQKLSNAGIDGSLYRWFTDYIRSPQQFVAVGCSHSSHGTPLPGVSQKKVPENPELVPSATNFNVLEMCVVMGSARIT